MASNYGAEEAHYLHLSGPHIWPNETSWQPVDRFICGARPEIRYRMALDRALEVKKPEPVPILRTRIYTIARRRRKNQRKTHLGAVDHGILEDPQEDVRSFLLELRYFLLRKMSPSPQFGTHILLEYVLPLDPRKPPRVLTMVSQEWR
jgi:hypothetical protein